MKKSRILVAILAILMLTTFNGVDVQAAPSISVTGNTSVKEGDTVSITTTVSMEDIQATGTMITFDSSVLQYVSCSDALVKTSNGYAKSTALWGGVSSATIKYTFKAIKTGSSTVSVSCEVSSSDDEFQVGKSVTVKVAAPINDPTPTPTPTPSPTEPSESSEARLSSMVVSPGTLSPEFDKSTYDYKVQVDEGVTGIAITAKTVDTNAKISSVNGADSLKTGANTVTVVTKAEAGNTKTYTIAVQVGPYPDEVVIEANVDGQTFRVAMDISDIALPVGSELSTIVIDENNVPCISYNQGMLFLVELIDEDGNGKLYSYVKETGTYQLFQEAVSQANAYVIKNFETDYKVPIGYKKVTITIGEYQEVEALILEDEATASDESDTVTGEDADETNSSNTRFYLIKAENMSGEENWYQYDSIEGTIQISTEPVALGVQTESTDTADNEEASTSERKLPINTSQIIILLSILCVGLAISLTILLAVQPKDKKNKLNDVNKSDND